MKHSKKALKWVNMSFRRTIAGTLAAFLLLPLFAPALAVAAESSATVAYQEMIEANDDLVSALPVEEEVAPPEEPAVSDEEPAVSDEEPAVSDEEPAVSDEEPAVSDEEPAVSDEEPAEDPVDQDDPIEIVPPEVTGGDETDVTDHIVTTDQPTTIPIRIPGETVGTGAQPNTIEKPVTAQGQGQGTYFPDGEKFNGPGPFNLDAPEDKIFEAVAIKAGAEQSGGGFFIFYEDAVKDGYSVSGLGTDTLEVMKVDPNVHDISHIEVIYSDAPVLVPDVSIEKSGPAEVLVGDQVTYTLTVENTGTATLHDVTVVDTLPPGIDYDIENDDNTGDYNDVARTITWTLDDPMEPGETVTIYVYAIATSPSDEGWINTANVTTRENTTDEDEAVTIVTEPEVPGVSIEKSGPAEVLVGDPVTYTLTVENTGTATLHDVTVVDTLPPGIDYDIENDDNTGDYNDVARTITWTLDDPMEPGETVTIYVYAIATSPSDEGWINTANVTTRENTTDEDEAVTIVENRVYGLSVQKTGPETVVLGDTITYDIVVENTGEETLFNVNVIDTMSEDDLELLEPLSGLSWTIPMLEPGEFITYTVKAKPKHGGVVRNDIVVFNSLVDDSDFAETLVLVPGVTITKVDSLDPILVGGRTVYTIKVTNTGDIPLTDVIVTDNLPPQLGFVSSSHTLNAGDGLSWNIGDLALKAAREITVEVSGDQAGAFTNKAWADANELANPAYAEEPTTVNAPNTPAVYSASIDKVDTLDPIMEGETTEYIITVKNTGNQALTKATLTDSLPSAFSFVAASAGAQVAGNELTWQLGTLEPGAVTEVRTTARGDSIGSHLNIARLDADELGEPVMADEPTVVETALKEQFGVRITKVDDVDPANIGQNVTYTITVTNDGESTLKNVKITDSLPAGLEFKSADAALEQTGDSDYTLSVNVLAPGESTKFKVVAKAIKTGTWTNVAEVDADNLDAPERATEKTDVVELVAAEVVDAPQNTAGDPAPKTGSSLPFTGFPLTIWWLTALAALVVGVKLEVSARRRARNMTA